MSKVNLITAISADFRLKTKKFQVMILTFFFTNSQCHDSTWVDIFKKKFKSNTFGTRLDSHNIYQNSEDNFKYVMK